MSLTMTMYKTKSPNNALAKTCTDAIAYPFVLKDDTSVVDPVLIVNTTTNISKYNYLYIDEFDRYYFIRDIVSVRNNVYEIHAHVDVLMSYQSEIKTMQGTMARSATVYNTYVDDIIPKKTRPLVTTRAFSTSFNKNDASIVLVVAGKFS